MNPFPPDDQSLEIYLKEISNLPQLSPEEERELIIRAKKGDREAIEKLLYAHLKFVVSFAYKYANMGVPLSDLINEGNLGLLKALKRFDPNRNVRFLSYAIWWVRQAILKALSEQSKLIKLSDTHMEKLKTLRNATRDIMEETGEMPSIKELSDLTGMSPQEIQKTYSMFSGEVSLDRPIYEDNEKRLLVDILGQTALPSPESYYAQKELHEVVEEALSTLSERERKILRLYFGLEDGTPKTLEEIGNMMGVSRERIRQLKDRALKKLKMRFGERLKDFLPE
ncbi:MAG: hypothetical protein DRQ03_01650 [Candidatus Hydrothermota bacterium]|nr:MAG: hypothetical protein DRQ03_01650 [Candidatus Hydrothermae bacterium]